MGDRLSLERGDPAGPLLGTHPRNLKIRMLTDEMWSRCLDQIIAVKRHIAMNSSE